MELYDASKTASYFIWDYVRRASALDHWYCAEDIGCYFETEGLLTYELLLNLCALPRHEQRYIDFVRNIAFRIYLHTNDSDELFNWYTAEKLLKNSEWLIAESKIASLFKKAREDWGFAQGIGIQSQSVRNKYLL